MDARKRRDGGARRADAGVMLAVLMLAAKVL
jgi:hypothetical protein